MSRVPLPYSPKILDLFKNPKNLGRIKDATVSAVAGSPACGDMIALYLKISKNEVIEKATFESYGCAANSSRILNFNPRIFLKILILTLGFF